MSHESTDESREHRAISPSEREARSARGNRTGLRIHAAAFAGTQALLAGVWAVNGGIEDNAHPWFIYPLLGWGVGVAAHYAAVRDKLKAHPDDRRTAGAAR